MRSLPAGISRSCPWDIVSPSTRTSSIITGGTRSLWIIRRGSTTTTPFWGTLRRVRWPAVLILQPFQHLRGNGRVRLAGVLIDVGEVGGLADTGGQVGCRVREHSGRGRGGSGRFLHRAGGEWVASSGVHAVLRDFPDGELQPRGLVTRGRRLVVQEPRNLLEIAYGRGWGDGDLARQQNSRVIDNAEVNVGQQLNAHGCAVECARAVDQLDVDNSGKVNVRGRAILVDIHTGIPEPD